MTAVDALALAVPALLTLNETVSCPLGATLAELNTMFRTTKSALPAIGGSAVKK
jgi:hypothetical protein